MWRAIYPLLLFGLIAFHQVSAEYFTEGGSYQTPEQQEILRRNLIKNQYAQQDNSDDQYYDMGQAYSSKQLANIVNRLEEGREKNFDYDRFGDDDGVNPYRLLGLRSNELLPPQQRLERANEAQSSSERKAYELEELQQFGKEIKELTEKQAQNSQSEEVLKPTNTKIYERPQKKGQSEFVEFIDPLNSKKLRNTEFMEKRVDPGHFSTRRALHLFSGFGNVAFMAFITMCCVMSVVGVVGGMYYYNHVRTAREDPFDDFTRYSPAGPGRDKLKRGGNQNGTFVGELGDDTLAYKAQLHHYQQNKQKIIGAEEGRIGNGAINNDEGDDISDNEADLEHNFSVYECPGLAPTGDIEVQNPNFVEKTD